MGKSGNSKKNPFIFYCLERQALKPVWKSKSLSELVALCGDDWANLSVSDRSPYVRMAKDHNANNFASYGNEGGNFQNDLTGRFDSFGRSLLGLAKAEEREKRLLNYQNKDIRQRVQTHRIQGDLTTMRIHLLHINKWADSRDGIVIPAEIGLVEMSISQGIITILNQKIDPGNHLPIGYKGEIRDHSEKTHKLWLDNSELSDNYTEILENMIAFLEINELARERPGVRYDDFEDLREEEEDIVYHEKSRRLLPLYVNSDEIENVQIALEWLNKVSSIDENIDFVLYHNHVLFWELIGGGPLAFRLTKTIQSEIMAKSVLERDVYLYTPGVSCEYHELIENCHCAAAIASRTSFIISNYCCQIYNVPIIEGHHLPLGINIQFQKGESSGCDSEYYRIENEEEQDEQTSLMDSTVQSWFNNNERSFTPSSLTAATNKSFTSSLSGIKDLTPASPTSSSSNNLAKEDHHILKEFMDGSGLALLHPSKFLSSTSAPKLNIHQFGYREDIEYFDEDYEVDDFIDVETMSSCLNDESFMNDTRADFEVGGVAGSLHNLSLNSSFHSFKTCNQSFID